MPGAVPADKSGGFVGTPPTSGSLAIIKMRHIILTTFLLFSITTYLYSQDTNIYETIKTAGHNLIYYRQEKMISEKIIEEINITNGEVWITAYRYFNDTVIHSILYLKPHLPGNLNEGTFIDLSDNDTIFYGENGAIYPCPCLISFYPIQFFTLQKVFNCRLDTFRKEKFVLISNKDSMLRTTFMEKNNKYILYSKEYYDHQGRRIREETHCDTFSVQFDSLGRKITESFVYNCDNFRYKLLYKYKKDIKYIYGIDNGKTHLSEKIFKIDSNKFKKIVFYSKSKHSEEIYQEEDKPLIRKEYNNKKLSEITEWEYINDKSVNAEIVIMKVNGIESSRIVKRKK